MFASIANTEIRQVLEKGLGTSPLHDMFSKELGISKDEAFICTGQCLCGSGYTGDSMHLR